jgi:hypothetical protein
MGWFGSDERLDGIRISGWASLIVLVLISLVLPNYNIKLNCKYNRSRYMK